MKWFVFLLLIPIAAQAAEDLMPGFTVQDRMHQDNVEKFKQQQLSEAEAERIAQDIQALLLQQYYKTMLAQVKLDPTLEGDAGNQFYKDFLASELSMSSAKQDVLKMNGAISGQVRKLQKQQANNGGVNVAS